MLIEGHIFTIKTKDPQNVADIKNVSTDVVISGLNVLKDQIAIDDLVFVVFGGDKPPWETGLVGLAKISKAPFDEGYDGKKNFRVGIDIVSFFEHITRGDLVSYPDTFDTIGIAPITKWEPNQAITSVPKEKAIALLQAVCELRPNIKKDVEKLLGPEFAQLTVPVKRYIETLKPFCGIVNLREEFRAWLTNVYRKKDGSALGDTSSYVNCLSYLTDASQHLGKYDERSTSYWYNMYHFLYGEDGASVFECLTRKDVEERFKGVIAAVIDGDAPDGVDIAHFNIVREWSNEPQVKKGSWVKCSFARYFEFLEWREAQNKPEDKKDELPPNVDRLSVALKLFAEKRKDDGEGGWFDTGFDVNANIRGYFDALTVDVLKGFGEEKITELFCGLKGSDGKTFEPMWSGKPGMGWGHIKPNDPEAVQKIVDFLVLLKSDASVSARFLDKDFVRPAGFGRSVISELLMKFHPDTCLKHGERSHIALVWLGLIDFDWRNDYSDAEYKQVCGAAAKILQKMQAMKIPRLVDADGSVDNSPPDYLTVNEFIYFVNTNQDLIKEKIMGAQWKPVDSKAKMKNGTKKLKDAMSDDMLKRLAAALRTKPFAILAGHSGTGKSQLVRRLAYMTCNNEMLIEEGKGKSAPGNYCMVQVKPNWHDSTDLLGYYSEMGKRHFVNTPFVEFICKAYAYPDTPFFVCLDEMNLAPVEQYFAEYLSAVESMERKDGVWVTDALVEVDKTGETDAEGKQKVDLEIVGQIMKGAASTEAAEWIQAHGLTIPKNLFVVGTVNMDETTCQFSRKVLDRAMTLLMNEVKFSEMANSKKPSEEELLDADGIKFFLEGEGTGAVGGIESGLLDDVNEQLGNTPFVIAYRFANEYALYEAAWAKLSDMDMAAATDDEKKNLAAKALDHVVMMKLLPRIHGERRVVEGIFNGRKDKRADGDKDLPGLKVKLPDGLSAKMMDEILARRDEYLTFWP